ncbi:MAG TPA: hypothetical protein VME86_10850 [Acidobacteriaceae bacterium]|nr:hypothetical protein [Acidobacteriaceae bacterium]
MEALRHLLGAMLFCGVFLLGKLMVSRRKKLADKLTPEFVDPEEVSKVFLYSGRTIETVSAIAGFLEAVAFLVLAF